MTKHMFAILLFASLTAIAGCSREVPLPSEQQALADDIKAKGGLVSADPANPEVGVRAVDLQGTGIDDAYVARLLAFPNLQLLNLRATKITDASVESLKKMKKLESLDVGDNKLSEKAKAQLRNAFAAITLLGAEEPPPATEENAGAVVE